VVHHCRPGRAIEVVAHGGPLRRAICTPIGSPFSRVVSQSHGSNRESCEAKVVSNAEPSAYSGHSCDIGSHNAQRRTQPVISAQTIQAEVAAA